MARKSREEELLSRLRAAGIAERSPQAEASFKFLISPKTSRDVDVRHLAIQFRDEVFRRIHRHTFESPISGIVLFPTIIDSDLAVAADKITYKRGEKAVFIALNIPFDAWDAASAERRIDLFAENILDSIERISSKYLSDTDKAKLVSAVNEVRQNAKAKLLH